MCLLSSVPFSAPYHGCCDRDSRGAFRAFAAANGRLAALVTARSAHGLLLLLPADAWRDPLLRHPGPDWRRVLCRDGLHCPRARGSHWSRPYLCHGVLGHGAGHWGNPWIQGASALGTLRCLRHAGAAAVCHFEHPRRPKSAHDAKAFCNLHKRGRPALHHLRVPVSGVLCLEERGPSPRVRHQRLKGKAELFDHKELVCKPRIGEAAAQRSPWGMRAVLSSCDESRPVQNRQSGMLMLTLET